MATSQQNAAVSADDNAASGVRGKTWGEEEVLAVISVFLEEDIQAMIDGTSRNTAVYKKVSRNFADVYNVHRTAKECQTKVNNLKSWYRRKWTERER